MRAYAHCRFLIALAALVCLGLLTGNAQESKEVKKQPEAGGQKKDDAKDPVVDYWKIDAGIAMTWSVAIVGQGEPLAALGTRVLATDDEVGLTARVPGWKFIFTEPVAIYQAYLDAIKDERPVPVLKVAKGKPLPESWQPGGADWGWILAFNEALRRSVDADADMFKTAAEKHAAVDYASLKRTPNRYRGKIVTVTGRLTEVRKVPIAAETLNHYFMGYIVDSTLGAPPIAVAFTEMPDKVEPGEELSVRVTFHGYFLSLIRSPGPQKGDKKQEEVTGPFLIGKVPVVSAADSAWPINSRYLEVIEDRRPLPRIAIVKGEPIPEYWEKPGGADWGWYNAFNDALRRCQDTDLDLLKKSAEEHKHVVYADLKNAAAQHRGKIITVTGRLSVLRETPAPRFIRDKNIYTGYIIGPTPGAPPFAFAVTELPDGVKLSERLDIPVTMHGYFLSLVRFPHDKKGATKEDDIISPYLVGKTFVVNTPPKAAEEENTPGTYVLVMSALGGIVGVAVLVAALNIWLRRGDRRIQAQLKELREKAVPFNLEPDEPAAENRDRPPEPGGAKPGAP